MSITQLNADIATLSANVEKLVAQSAASVPQAEVDAADVAVNAVNAAVVAALAPAAPVTPAA